MAGSYCYPYPHPAVTADIAVFSLRQQQLQLLLIRRGGEPFKGCWALPGGFLDIDEDLESCAARELEEETGVRDLYLEQVCAFGRPQRDPRERVISVAYFALVPVERLQVRAASDAAEAGWFALNALPELAFDHAEIIRMARQRLAAKLDDSTLAFQFMPKAFTLDELQQVYEILRQAALDKRDFRNSVLHRGLLEETGETRSRGNRRAARLYRVKQPDRVGYTFNDPL